MGNTHSEDYYESDSEEETTTTFNLDLQNDDFLRQQLTFSDEFAQNLLYYAVVNEEEELCELILQQNKNLDMALVDDNNETVLQIAKRQLSSIYETLKNYREEQLYSMLKNALKEHRLHRRVPAMKLQDTTTRDTRDAKDEKCNCTTSNVIITHNQSDNENISEQQSEMTDSSIHDELFN